MPKRLRELICDLNKAGFVNRGGKGNHQNLTHLKGTKITLSGSSSHDEKQYQEREVRKAICEVMNEN